MATTFLPLMSSSSLKRRASTDDDSDGYIRTKIRICLEEDEYSSSGEAESIYSLQNHDTATAHDTSDTDEDEYEVQTETEVTLSELSSGPENHIVIGPFSAIVEHFGSEIEYVADLSDESSSSDSEITRSASRRTQRRGCEKCKGFCEDPFTLCLKCFRQRRMYLPTRPKGKRKRDGRPRQGESALGSSNGAVGGLGRLGSLGSLGSQGSEGSLASSQGSVVSVGSVGSEEENRLSQPPQQQGSSQEPSNLCKCCFSSPVDGVFIHKDTVHPMYCYPCSMKQWQTRGRCAFCNQKCRVAKIFPVE